MAARAKKKKVGKRVGLDRKSASGRPATGAKKAAKKAASKKQKVSGSAAKPAAVAKRKPAAEKTGAVRAADGGAGLGAGATAPDFELLDQAGASVSSEELKGQPYVLYFYPKDDTPGCTTEACGFRDALPEFEELGVRVFGVSPDGTASHQKFAAKYELPFTLLSDVDKALASAYGVWALKKNYGREYMGVIRSTFLVAADGVIQKAWQSVRVNGHVAEVRAEAEKLANN